MPGWFDSLFISEEEQSRAREVDAKLNALNASLAERGIITEQDERERLARIQGTSIDRMLADPQSGISSGFQQGLAQGADNIRGALNSVGNTVLGTSLKLIPWWLWAAAAAYGLVILWPYIPKPKTR